MEEYFYDLDNVCYIFKKVTKLTCSLHGEFICMAVEGVKIKTSGKTSNCVYTLSLDSLHKNSRDYLSLKYPELKKTD